VEKRISLSNIIKQAKPTSTVFIGDKHFDFEEESRAEATLASFCPAVAVQTDPDGAKLIPITEVFKIEKTFQEEKQKAYQEGYQDGYREGLQQGESEARKVLQQFEQAIRDVVEQREMLLEEARRKVLDLVIQVSRKVTFDAVSADPETTLTIINGVINELVDRSKLKIKVNPDHLPVIEQNVDRFLKGFTSIKEITIEPDPRVRYGGCFIETPTGDIDARLESQLKVIEEALSANEAGS
jgi:flagellar assembly protein FliH